MRISLAIMKNSTSAKNVGTENIYVKVMKPEETWNEARFINMLRRTHKKILKIPYVRDRI